MGWLDVISVGLNLTNAAMNASNAAKLQEMQRQGATADAMRALTSVLRDQILRYKQTAEAILAGEAKSPKIAAGSMKFLEINLDESQISPSLFLELGDKEYCVNTTRLIRENSARMFGQLTPDEQAEVGRVIDAASRKPDYEYYLANYDSYQAMKAAEPTYNKLASRNSCAYKMLYVVWAVVGAGMMPFIFLPLAAVDRDAAGFLGAMCGVAALVIYVVGFVVIARYQKSGEFGKVKPVVEQAKAKMDVPRMQKLDAEIGGAQQAQRLQGQAQATLDSFLQGAKLLPS